MMVGGELSAPPVRVPDVESPGVSPGVSVWQGATPLRAAFGQDEANHGTARYPVGNDGLIWVPLEAVGPLAAIGGFAMAKARDDVTSAGTLKLRHTDAAGCSYGGSQYPSDANGDVLVPAEAARELMAHGFIPSLPAAISASRPAKSSGDRFTKG